MEIVEYGGFGLTLGNGKFISENIDGKKYIVDIIENNTYLLEKYLIGIEKNININDNIYNIDDIIEINNNYYISYCSSHNNYNNYNKYNLSLYYNYNCIENQSFSKLAYTNVESNNNMIKIGTINKNINIPLNLLYNSEFIKNMMDDLNVNSEIIHSSLEDIDLYYKFIKNEEIENNKLYNLFSICNFLIDKNINIVSMMIIEYIQFNRVDITEAFSFLKLYSSSIYDDSIKLLYVILEKYEFNQILLNFEKIDKNSSIYNICFKELLNYSVNSIKDNLNILTT